MKTIIILVSLLFSSQLFGETLLPQSPGPEVLDQISKLNQATAELEAVSGQLFNNRNAEVLPFAEYQKTGYVFFNDDEYRGYAKAIKSGIAKNLPSDVTLVVYTTSGDTSYHDQLKKNYLEHIDSTQLKILQVPRSGSNSFWTRDNLPLPVWTDSQFTLVDARYYYNFEPDDFLINLFGSLSTKHNYFFEGGNFIANSRGECIVVNRRRSYPGGISDTAAIPDSVFKNQYGCKKLTRFKHLKGIGHADEVVKFMTDDIIMTDTPEYATILESLGYQVHMLPEPDLNYETYANALQVNDVLFVPSFNEAGDKQALEAYESLNLGLKIVALPTKRLATRGQGGIHCITMNYPPVPMAQLIQQLKAIEIY